MTSKELLETAVSEYNLFHFSDGDFHRHAFLREQCISGSNVLILSVPSKGSFVVKLSSEGLDSLSGYASEEHYNELLERMLLFAMDIKQESI